MNIRPWNHQLEDGHHSADISTCYFRDLLHGPARPARDGGAKGGEELDGRASPKRRVDVEGRLPADRSHEEVEAEPSEASPGVSDEESRGYRGTYLAQLPGIRRAVSGSRRRDAYGGRSFLPWHRCEFGKVVLGVRLRRLRIRFSTRTGRGGGCRHRAPAVAHRSERRGLGREGD